VLRDTIRCWSLCRHRGARTHRGADCSSNSITFCGTDCSPIGVSNRYAVRITHFITDRNTECDSVRSSICGTFGKPICHAHSVA
jgi:hypothetical protein